MSHTPGPWTAEEWGEDFWYVSFGDFEGRIVNLDRRKDGDREYIDRVEADAHLIAAAPDLLDALRHLYSVAEKMEGVAEQSWRHAIKKAKAAMAKAEGR